MIIKHIMDHCLESIKLLPRIEKLIKIRICILKRTKKVSVLDSSFVMVQYNNFIAIFERWWRQAAVLEGSKSEG